MLNTTNSMQARHRSNRALRGLRMRVAAVSKSKGVMDRLSFETSRLSRSGFILWSYILNLL